MYFCIVIIIDLSIYLSSYFHIFYRSLTQRRCHTTFLFGNFCRDYFKCETLFINVNLLSHICYGYKIIMTSSQSSLGASVVFINVKTMM